TRNGVRRSGDAPRCGPDGTSLPGWRSWKRRRLLIVSPQVRVLPLVLRETRDTPPPSGTGAALRRQRLLVRIQPAVLHAITSFSIWSGTHLGSGAAVYRSRRVRFSSGPRTPGYPNQQRTPAQTRCVAG